MFKIRFIKQPDRFNSFQMPAAYEQPPQRNQGPKWTQDQHAGQVLLDSQQASRPV